MTTSLAQTLGSLALWKRVRPLSQARVDIAWLAAFRVLFGLAMAASAARFVAYGWVERLFLTQQFCFKYYGFSWVERLPAPYLHAVFCALGLLGISVAIGAFYRASALLLALGLTYVQLIDVSNYLNHYYLAGLLAWLLTCLPAARAYSLDAWRSRKLGRLEAPSVSVLCLYLLRLQVTVVYLFAGIAKAQSDWLLHGQPLRIWLSARSNLPVVGDLLMLDGAALVMSWAGFLFDTTIPFFLLSARSRPLAFLVVLLFHLGTRLLFPIGMFPVIMVLSALAFFSPSWPRALFAKAKSARLRIARAPSTPKSYVPSKAGSKHETWSKSGRTPPGWVLALGMAYAVLQVLLPLRAFAYPGQVLWHEQGMRFSWRVMVRAKGGSTNFRVVIPGREKPVVVNPRQYLTGLQESEMSSQPDLILQLAHRIRDDYQRTSGASVQVYADSRVALNGRRSQPFLNPTIDLAQIRDGLSPIRYVMPAPTVPPPHTRPTR